MPYFDSPADGCGEVSTGWRKGEGCDFALEGEMVKGNSPGKVCKDRAAFLVNGQQEVSARVEGEAGDVVSVGKREGV
jgi:hypothetical protein